MSIHLGLLKFFHELDIFQSRGATGIVLESLQIFKPVPDKRPFKVNDH
jgi:hypothetical protein